MDITEPLTEPAMASPSPAWTSPADDLQGSKVSRLLPKVTCPSPFDPHARTVPITELQDVPVTEARKREQTAVAPVAGKLPTPFDPTSAGWHTGKPIAGAKIQLELLKGQKNLHNFFC